MARKREQYITDGYIEQANHYLYNDLPILDLYKDVYKNFTFNKKKFESMLLKGEKYVRLKYEFEHIAITDRGRIFNLKKYSQFIIKFSQSTIVMYVQGTRIDLAEVFEEQGWDYDVRKIYKDYIKHNWKMQVPYVKIADR